jgi:hypothetical protein
MKPIERGRKAVKRPLDHVLLKLLIDKGYSRENVARALGLSTVFFIKAIKRPSLYFTMSQLLVIAGMLDKPFYEIVGLVIGYKEGRAKSWYEQ